MSVPNHSRSDGKAKAAVKIAKRLLKRSQDTSHTRVAAVDLGTSPCQRLIGRRTRSVVPLNESEEVRALSSDKGLGEDIQEHQHRHGKILPPLQVIEPVLVKDVKLRRPRRTSLLYR